MASVNKISIRKEVDRLKQEFKRLCSTKKGSLEMQALMNSLMIIVELMVSIFMEKRTPKNSKNSSLPSSQTIKEETAKNEPQSNSGKGKKVHGKLSNTRVKKTVTIVTVKNCDGCGASLDNISCHTHERRTKIDIVFEKVIEHIDAEIKQCQNCQTVTKGKFPQDMPGPLQYGNGLKAFVVHLIINQMISLNRVSKQVAAMIGEALSEATLLKFVWRLNEALEQWESKVKKNILQQSIIHVDETSFRVESKNYWIHVYSSGETTLKLLHRKRGKVAIQELNIIPRYGGIIIHDCWASYLSYDHCGHALCGSHLLRELTFIVDSNGYKWAKNMKKLLQEVCYMVAQKNEKCLTNEEYSRIRKRYRTILSRGKKELPEIPPKPNGQRGKMAKSDADNLLERLCKHETAVLLFSRESYVPFTNNRAERDLRLAKVKQKISGCFRQKKYAQAYCRISSYLQTMTNQGVNPFVAIQIALTEKS